METINAPGDTKSQQQLGVSAVPIRATRLTVGGVASSAALLFGLINILIFGFFSVQSLFPYGSIAQQLASHVPSIVELLIALAFFFVSSECFTIARKTRWISASATWAVFTGIGAFIVSLTWVLMWVDEVIGAFSYIGSYGLFLFLTLMAAIFFALGAIKAKKTFFVSTKAGLIAAILLAFFVVSLLLYGLFGELLLDELIALGGGNVDYWAAMEVLEILSFIFVFLPLIAFSVCLAVFLASVAEQLRRGNYRLNAYFTT